jgi:enoyl-CoA hydratase/carnithine racemase
VAVVALAAALDFRIMARDAHLRVPEIGLGISARTVQPILASVRRIPASVANSIG